jgi:hypothetical protein
MIHTFLAMKDSDPNNKIGAMKYFATAVGGDDDEDDDWEPPKNPDLIDGFQTIQIPKPLNPFPDISAYSGDK